MVFAGNVEFGVQFERGSIDQAVAGLRQQFSRVPNLEIGVDFDRAAARGIASLRQQLNSIGDVDLDLDINADARPLRQVGTELDRLSNSSADQNLRQINRELSNLGNNSRQARRNISGIDSILAGFSAVTGAFASLTAAVTDFARSTAEVGTSAIAADAAFTTILGSATEAQRVLGELSEFAATTPFDLPGVRDAGQQLLAFGFSTQELIPTLTAVGDVAAGVGVPFGELAEIYGRARVQNRLFAEDINQLTGRGIPIIGELADQFGVAESEVKSLVESGQVGFGNLEQAFQSLTAEGGTFSGLLGQLSQTTQGQFSNLGDTITRFQESLFRAVDPALGAGLQVISDSLAEAASESRGLDILGASAQRLADSLQSNPELVERLGSAIATLADSSASAAAEVLDRINQALENPETARAFAAGIEDLGQGIEDFTSGALELLDLIQSLIDGLERLGLASSLEDFQGGINFEESDGLISRAFGIGAFAFDEAEPGFGRLTNVAETAANAINESLERITAPEIVPETSGVDQAIQASQNLKAIQDRLAQSDIERINALTGVATAQLSAGDAAAARAQAEIETARRSIAIQQEQIDVLQAQDPAANADEIQRIEARIANARLEIAQTQADERVRIERETTQQIQDELNARGRLNELTSQQVSIQFDVDSGGLEDQLSLSRAIADLDQSRIQSARLILDAQLAQASALEDFQGIEAARDRILLNQLSSVQASFTAQRRQLGIQEQIARLDAQRQVALAEIARSEAQIAVERARASGDTTDQELRALESIVDLRNQEIDRVREQFDTQSKILNIQLQQLSVDEEIAGQQAINQRRQEALESALERQNDLLDEQKELEKDITDETERRRSAIDSIIGALGGLQDISADDALGNLDRLEENLRTASRFGAIDSDLTGGLQEQIDRAQRLGQDGFSVEEAFRFSQENPDNQFTQSILDSLGFGGINQLNESGQEFSLAESQITELTGKLDEVKSAIESLPDSLPAGVETLNVTTPDPVVDSATVLAQMNRQHRIAQGAL